MKGRRSPLLVVGQAPGRTPRGPLLGPSGNRLARAAGLSLLEWSTCVERVNLLRRWPGRDGKGDRFPLKAARVAAEALAPRLVGRRVVLLGRGVARAFCVDGVHPQFEWWYDAAYECAIALAPHPSGVNLWWNSPSNLEMATAFWRAACASNAE